MTTSNIKIIDNRFTVDKLLGSGGFGHVFKARDESLERTVAVKVLEVIDPDAQTRFEREAQVLSTLQHPHIVSVYNYGADESKRPYISMQYLEGQTLRDVLIRDGKVEWRRATAIFAQVCQALQAAHAAGVVHRDLKPENIMLLDEPEPDYVKVLDFGLSGYVYGAEGAVQRLTQTGAIVGTALYLSPEACQGSRADARSDVYSLGCVLYECISGEAALKSEDELHVLYKHLHEMPPRLNDNKSIPPVLEQVCFKAMQKNADDRFQSMAEFEQALNAVRAEKSDLQLGKVQFATEAPTKKRANARIVASTLIAVGAAVVASFAFFSQHQTETAKSDAWKNEHDLATISWTRRSPDGAREHYRAALKAAQTSEQRYLSELAIGRSWLDSEVPDKTAKKEMITSLEAALRDAPDLHDANVARTLLGMAYYVNDQYDEAVAQLRDHPWTSLPHAKDGQLATNKIYITRATRILAECALFANKPDYKIARDTLDECLRFGKSAPAVDFAGTEFLSAYCDLESPYSTEEQKQTAIATYKRIAPLLQSSWQLRNVRYALGEEEFAKLKIHHSETKVPLDFDPRPRELYVDGQFWSLGAAIHMHGAPADVPQLDLLTAINQLRRAVNGTVDINDALHECETLLTRTPNKTLHILMNTLMGVACSKTGEYDKAIKYLGSEPWLQAGQTEEGARWRHEGEVALGISYLMRANPDYEKAEKILTNIALHSTHDYLDRKATIFGDIAAVGRGEKLSSAQRSSLKRLLSTRTTTLTLAESEFIKKQLTDHNMMDLW